MNNVQPKQHLTVTENCNSEMNKRQNVVTFGIEEGEQTDSNNRIQEDMNNFNDTCNILETEAEPTRIVRLGKVGQAPRKRPMRVTVKSTGQVSNILRAA